MPENNRSIGSTGLEQGGPNLGNDITRDDMSIRNAGDALTNPTSMGSGPGGKNEDDTSLTEDDELEVDDDDDDLLADDELDEDDDEVEEEDKTL